jgi:hypothetical protein
MSEAAKARFANGATHPMKGKRHTPETRQRMSERVKASQQSNGHPCVGRIVSLETRRKIGEANKGRPSHRKGAKHTAEARAKMSEAALRRFAESAHPLLGRALSDEHRNKISKTMIERRIGIGRKGTVPRGERNPNWRGGVSFEPYPTDWTSDLKESIRRRDGYACRLCGKTQDENGSKLDVHHIDYDKGNLDPQNLISLCVSCHRKTNGARLYWQCNLRALRGQALSVA